MHYHVLCSKPTSPAPMIVWFKELDAAKDFVRKHEFVGYNCSIWKHTETGATPMYNVLGYTDKISLDERQPQC